MHFAEIATSISAPSTPRPRENQDEKSFKVMIQAFDDVEPTPSGLSYSAWLLFHAAPLGGASVAAAVAVCMCIKMQVIKLRTTLISILVIWTPFGLEFHNSNT